MMILNYLLLLFLSIMFICSSCQSSLLIVIRSQANEYNNRLAIENKASLEAQIKKYDLQCSVILLHHKWKSESAWTILPILPDIAKEFSDSYDWVMFIEDLTKVDLKQLVTNVLPNYDFTKDLFLGRCLFDRESTIIHHYAHFDGKVKEFYYPDFHAGWILSKALVKKVGFATHEIKPDFQIDIQHELAMFFNEKYSLKMTCSEEICGKAKKDDCVTWVDHAIPDCGNKIKLDDLLFSVTTTKMFHNTRLQVVKTTWGKYPKNIIYYSNVTDASIPTTDCGVPNTLTGHCGKTEAIIKFAHKKEALKRFPWLVLADDDSILGLSALVKLLNCYDPKIPVVLGERYGYGLTSGYGYSYVTGGAGVIMSRSAIDIWFKNDCKCSSIDSPEDMWLGQCFSSIGIPVTNSPRFHQARPQDYSTGYITNLQPVSFHKHYQVDPFQVYESYFAKDDEAAFNLPFVSAPTEAPEAIPMPIPPTPTEVPLRDEL